MPRVAIINDVHFGVRRSAGTTPESRLALEKWMFEQFDKCLAIPHDKLLIAGDLFDKRSVPEHVMLEVVKRLRKEDCSIMLGNHDTSGISDGVTISSAEFVAKLSGCEIISAPRLWEGVYCIPHLFNQQRHEEAIAEVPDDVILVTHCNIDNPWASGEHSLNLSLEEIKALELRGVAILAAHEHANRKQGIVTVLGNNFPSSIADCLGGSKYCHILEDGVLKPIETWNASDFCEMHHSEMFPTDVRFIRITGECAVAEYAEVVRKIAAYRKTSNAFIVASSVKPVTKEQTEFEQNEVDQFNIMELLLGQVDEDFREEVKSCI
jgi:hypothetical protein